MLGANMAAFGPLLAQLLGGGQMPAGGMDESGALPTGTPADANSDIPEGVVSGWKPKKRSTLGFLGDVLLGAFGGQPAFGQRMQRRNMQEAMEGFTQDPLESIRRLGQIEGQQGNAWQLYNQYQDNARADRLEERQQEILRERARDRVASMMGGANAETWAQAVPQMRRYAEARGLDPDEIPEQYDENAIAVYRMGGVPVDDQIDNSRDAQYKSERLRQIDQQEQGRNDRYFAGQDRQDARTAYIQDRIEKRSAGKGGKGAGSLKSRYGGKAFRDANGSLVEFNKDGTAMKMTTPSGNVAYYQMGVDGKPVHLKSISKEEAVKAAEEDSEE